MTSEEDFLNKLRDNPKDWQLRLVFADWLQERNDPRADGMRVVGGFKMFPDLSYEVPYVESECEEPYTVERAAPQEDEDSKWWVVPADWFHKAFRFYEPPADFIEYELEISNAFQLLSADRRQHLLSRAAEEMLK
jgi:uncharacterized protein (TIGR02996 family)